MKESDTDILSECENKETESEEKEFCRFINEDDGTEKIITIKELVEMMSEKTKEGDAAAAYILSDLYFKGRGVPKDIRKAYELMKWSADKGYADAQYNMAGAYLVGDTYDLQQNVEKGIRYLKLAAEQRDSYAMRMLGKYHLTGEYGIQKSNKKAFYYLSEAAKGDNIDALFEVSELYYFGVGTRKSIKKSIEYCKAAADKGYPEAQYSMWLHFCDDDAKISYEEAYEYLVSAAQKGLEEANNYLGRIFYADECFDEAFHYFEFAADKGCIDAMYRLGECYYHGEGTAENLEKAFSLYKKAANFCHDRATYDLAWCYDYGQGTQKNPKLAFEFYKKAARLGHVLAINNLGVCYATGKGTDKNIKKAIACYSVAARYDVKESINSLGSFYETGNGLEKDISKAIEFYEKATSLGDSSGAFNLARCYQFGMGVDKDVSKAIDLYIESSHDEKDRIVDKFMQIDMSTLSGSDAYRIAVFLLEIDDEKCKSRAFDLLIGSAESGFAEAQKYLAKLFFEGDRTIKSETLSVLFWSEVAKQDVASAIYNLGTCYYNGKGVTRNPERAFELYKKSADMMFPMAIFEVGNAYEKGFDGVVEPDYKKAIEYYEKGIELGNADCMNNLAMMYMVGKGVRKNRKKAYKLFLEAADLSEDAKCNLAMCYEKGCGTEEDFEQAIITYRELADKENRFAIESLERLSEKIDDSWIFFDLALCYDFGKGVECDIKKAVEYYTRAAEMGNDKARHNLAHLYRYGAPGLEIDYEKAIKYYSEAADKGAERSRNALAELYDELGEFEKAFEQYEKSAHAGNKTGLYYLARCYASGNGTEKDIPKAIEILKKLINDRYPEAINGLALVLSEDEKTENEAVRLFEKAITEYNDEVAMYNLGLCYENGGCGVEVNIPLAVEYYYCSAEEGYEQAIEKIKNFDLLSKARPDYIRKIAFDYYEDEEQQRKLYEIAAAGGDATAIYNVAFDLEKTDPQKAFELYKKSAALKEHYGIYAIAKCYEDGTGTEKDEKMYFKYLKKTVQSSVIPEAITDLGSCYGKGKVTAKNNKKAMRLYLKAALLGDVLALTNIAWFYETGTGVEKNTDIAYHLYKTAAESGEKHALERLMDWDNV